MGKIDKSLMKQFRDAHNKLRKDPKSYIPALEDRLKRMDGKRLLVKENTYLVTKEGAPAVKEAIKYLTKVKPIEERMKISKALCKAAQDHAEDSGASGLVGHIGTDRSTMDDRINRYVMQCNWKGESINYRNYETAEDVIIDLLIDDGVKDRGHRKNLFNANFNCLGVGVADHKVYEKCVVIVYSSDVTPIKSSDGYIGEFVNSIKARFSTSNKDAKKQTGTTQKNSKSKTKTKKNTSKGSWFSSFACCGKSSSADQPRKRNMLPT